MKMHVAIVPRDGFFFKDGRGWFTSASGRGHGLHWPYPSTIAGALRTAWGRRREETSGSALTREAWELTRELVKLGASFPLRRRLGEEWEAKHRLWPVPADALYLEDEEDVYRLDPVPYDEFEAETTAGEGEADSSALWWPKIGCWAKPLAKAGWWDEESFVRWLCGETVRKPKPAERIVIPKSLRIHVGINADTQTADEGRLFSQDFMETLEKSGHEWAVGCEVILEEEGEPDGLLTLGADGMMAGLERADERLLALPSDLIEAFERERPSGMKLFLVTPARYDGGWLPDGFGLVGGEYVGGFGGRGEEYVLKAAMVPRPVHVSGWDMAANAPKDTDRLVPAGAVYHFVKKNGRPFDKEDVEFFWLYATGTRTEEGFGRVVPGIWKPKRS